MKKGTMILVLSDEDRQHYEDMERDNDDLKRKLNRLESEHSLYVMKLHAVIEWMQKNMMSHKEIRIKEEENWFHARLFDLNIPRRASAEPVSLLSPKTVTASYRVDAIIECVANEVGKENNAMEYKK